MCPSGLVVYPLTSCSAVRVGRLFVVLIFVIIAILTVPNSMLVVRCDKTGPTL